MVTLVNRAKMSTSTTGTGTITLGSAETGYQSFADAGVADGDVVRYVIEDGDDWEIGSGTYTATGTTLTRTVDESSNSDAALNLTGSAVVFITAAAEDVFQGELYSESYDGTSTKPSANGTNTIAIGVNAYTVNENSIAIGTNASAQGGTSAVALGNGADARQVTAVAIGFDSYANGSASVALGRDAQAISGSNATAISKSYASGAHSFAAAIANNSSSYGATGDNSVAMGYLAKATGIGSVAIGYTAATSNWYSVALGRSNASGNYSFAAAVDNNTSTYGAIGQRGVAMGYQAKASGSNSVSLGDRSIASGANSISLGRSEASGAASVAIGLLADATAQGAIALGNGYAFNGAQATFYNSIAIGQGSLSDKIGKVAISGSAFSASGDGQHGIFVLRVATTDATATPLITGPDYSGSYTADTENQIILPNNSAYSFSGTIIARESATDGSDYASWEIKGALLRDANAASTVLGNGIVNKLYATSGASTWAVALSADTTNGGLKVEVTGAAATNIRWVATVNTSEVTYA